MNRVDRFFARRHVARLRRRRNRLIRRVERATVHVGLTFGHRWCDDCEQIVPDVPHHTHDQQRRKTA